MATSRMSIECPGCQSGVTLRIAVGFEENQDFYFVCPACESAVRGCLKTDQDEGEIRGLEIDGRPALMCLGTDTPVVNINTEFPMHFSATSEESVEGSGFIMHSANLGDRFHRWRQTGAEFDQSVDGGWDELRRWWGFYARRDWERFDAVARELFGNAWPVDPPMIARHDSINRLVEGLFIPLYPKGEYVRWKISIFGDLSATHMHAVGDFAEAWSTAARIRDARDRLFDVLDQFVAQRAKWRGAQLRDEYEDAGIAFSDDWRLMRDDFRSLRDLFITIFERSHQHLPMLMGFHNAASTGDPARFPDGRTASISKLARLSARDRGDFLVQLDHWGLEIESMLDRPLRNAIGHAEAIHDLSTGDVTWAKGSIPYTQFAAAVAAAVQVPLLLLNAVKYVSIASDLNEGT